MKTTQQLKDLGQSLWLDNITRGILADGTLRRYISDLAVTGLTSNPTIFDEAIKKSNFYDDAIGKKTAAGGSGEALFFELALEDLTQAADLFRPAYDASSGIDGWVSLEVSPLLANDTAGTIKAARTRLAMVDVGGLVARDVDAMVLPDEALSENLLGLSFLSKLKRFEYANGKMVLEQ